MPTARDATRRDTVPGRKREGKRKGREKGEARREKGEEREGGRKEGRSPHMFLFKCAQTIVSPGPKSTKHKTRAIPGNFNEQNCFSCVLGHCLIPI